MDSLPALRVRRVNDAPPRPGGRYVLYWMNAARRTRANFALQGAWEAARERGVPLLVLEAIGLDHRWASPRFHRFVLDGMRDQAARLGAAYYPYVERTAGAGRGLVAALARDAALVVTDDWPCFHLPRRVEAAGRQLDVALLAVDSNGLLPVRDAPATPFPTAYAFRRHLQARLPAHLGAMPADDPLPDTLPEPTVDPAVLARWAPGLDVDLATLPLDHEVGPVSGVRGGAAAAEARLTAFLARIERYAEDRNDVARDVPSGLSPYLHFGHVSAHTVVRAVLSREGWSPESVRAGGNGSRSGWWHAGEAAEAFLDQVVTWRELGFNLTSREPAYDRWESLPAWARATLEDHAGDPRPHRYDHATLERAATHDPLWNAAQRQLRAEGRIHNYLRMLWGKKVLEWSATPQEGFATLVALNDRWALDGRDPNSYTGISWVFGKYDRPWGPRRPIFGTIRYMSSDNTAKKLDVRGYLARWGTQASLF